MNLKYYSSNYVCDDCDGIYDFINSLVSMVSSVVMLYAILLNQNFVE